MSDAPDAGFDAADFRTLMHQLADAWAATDAEAAAALFTADAAYVEPPDRQGFFGRREIEAYFSPLEAGTFLDLHHVWFDAKSGTGAVEFSFGVRGKDTADHGVAVVSIRDGLISSWREYHVKGPASFAEFIDTADKDWHWHIGNYP